jgi:hypothetical protein
LMPLASGKRDVPVWAMLPTSDCKLLKRSPISF